MDNAAFFAALRKRSSRVFGTSLSQTQVNMLEALLERGAHLDNPSLACVLGNVYHECNMTPKRESMYYTAGRMMKVWPSRFPNIASTRGLARNPKALANKVYGRRLGNHQLDDGWRFRGGLAIQLTGRANYAKFGLENATEAKLLSPALNADVTIRGMEHGMFTGKRLSDYLSNGRYDFKGSRAIVNDDVGRVGAEVAGHCRAFLDALQEAGRASVKPPTAPRPIRAGLFVALLNAFFGGGKT